MLSQEQLNNLTQSCIAAVASERTTGCPADLTVPQWVLESGWGKHLPPGSNNPFGIKAVGDQPFVSVMTTEYIHGTATQIEQRFRAYPTLKDAFDAHGSLIATGAPYGAVFEQYESDQNILTFIRGVASHYATDPNYATEVINILLMTPVQQALQTARKSEQ